VGVVIRLGTLVGVAVCALSHPRRSFLEVIGNSIEPWLFHFFIQKLHVVGGFVGKRKVAHSVFVGWLYVLVLSLVPGV
jgi:hypothetical protein